METEQQTRTNTSLNWFDPLEGFEGRVHGRCIRGHLGDLNTESSVDTCCWGEHKRLCQLHNSCLENLKEKIEYMFKWMYFYLIFWLDELQCNGHLFKSAVRGFFILILAEWVLTKTLSTCLWRHWLLNARSCYSLQLLIPSALANQSLLSVCQHGIVTKDSRFINCGILQWDLIRRDGLNCEHCVQVQAWSYFFDN